MATHTEKINGHYVKYYTTRSSDDTEIEIEVDGELWESGPIFKYLKDARAAVTKYLEGLQDCDATGTK